MGGIAGTEKLIKLHLANRFLWLALGLALVLIGQLSYWQYRFERFDTLLLMSHLTVIIEAALVAAALICALATPTLRERMLAVEPARAFDYLRSAIAGTLTLVLCAVVLLTPVLILHRYPELLEENINVPLMMLQRIMLLLAAVLATYHVTLALRYYLRAPWGLCAALGLLWHIGFGYLITYLSFRTEAFRRLNDVFYYNQLWRYSDSFPVLQRPEVFHNIQQPYYGYLLSALLLVCAALALVAPGALALTAREQRALEAEAAPPRRRR